MGESTQPEFNLQSEMKSVTGKELLKSNLGASLMLHKKTMLLTSTILVVVILIGLGFVTRRAGAVEQPGEEAIAELKKRVARLEAEVVEMRKALLRPGGAPDNATEIKNVAEVAKLRAAEVLQRAQTTHALLTDIHNGKFAGRERQAKINDLNNDLASLWMTMAGYGVGRDPYLDHIRLCENGSSNAKSPPDFGIPGPYAAMGLPRLHERFLEASGITAKESARRTADFKSLVQAYSNPAVYQHGDFYDRAYNNYRAGKELLTPQYIADLKALDLWLTELEAAMEKAPTHFNKGAVSAK
jgi:hypothetical protein